MYRQFINKSVQSNEEIKILNETQVGKKWCNFVCQDFVDEEYFYSTEDCNKKDGSCKTRFLCIPCCRSMEKLQREIKKGKATIEMFKENPHMYDKPAEADLVDKIITCAVCKIAKSGAEYDTRRNVCKLCRYHKRKTDTVKNIPIYMEEIEKIKESTNLLTNYLKKLNSQEVYQLAKNYNISSPRNVSMIKEDVIARMVLHFEFLKNPYKCRGNCDNTLLEKFSYCDYCKAQENTDRVEVRNLKFKENIAEFMEDFYEIKQEDEYKYNLEKIYAICQFLKISKRIKDSNGKEILLKKKDLLEKINEKLKPKRDARDNVVQSIPDIIFNDIAISSREDGFINATQMCKSGGKKFNDWHRLISTQELILSVQEEIKSEYNGQLIIKDRSEIFIHPMLWVSLAQWISPKLSLKISRYVRELAITGKCSLKTKTHEELLKLQKEYKILKDKHDKLVLDL
jgi:hypothetical protein